MSLLHSMLVGKPRLEVDKNGGV
ncbi:uncharacterized protein METZ01_LOCUS512659 [marine metagenome]|uniref:Uncharacterized protein n=1 Tax=marine metagenome TaxID=408172 RepID=A0A383EU85_9ZZZZ